MASKKSSPSKGPKNGQSSAPPPESQIVTQTRINGRFLLTSLVLVSILAVGLHLLHGVQVENNADQLLERADAAEADGEYGKAVGLLSQYLSFREDDYETLLRQVRLRDGLATDGRTLARVLLGYEEVLRRNPDRPDIAEIRQDAIAVAMDRRVQDYSVALDHLDLLLEGDAYEGFREEHPDKVAKMHFQRGQCHHAEGRIEDAYDAYLQSLNIRASDPALASDPEPFLALAQLFVESHASLEPRSASAKEGPEKLTSVEEIPLLLPKQGQRDYKADEEADKILQLMVDLAEDRAKADPADDDRAQTYLARARFRSQIGEPESVREDVDEALRLAPDDSAILLFSANLGLARAKNERHMYQLASYSKFLAKAREAVNTAQTQSDFDPRFHLLEAQIEDESRKGYYILLSEKVSEPNQKDIENSRLQTQWKHFDAAKLALEKGLTAAKAKRVELETTFPESTRLREENPEPGLSRIELRFLEFELKWSLADILITQLEELRAEPSSASVGTIASLKEDVKSYIDELEKTGAPRGKADFLTARLKILDEDWREAAWMLKKSRNYVDRRSDLIHRIDLLLDHCYGQVGNPDEQLQVMIRANKEDPTWIPAILRLPECYQSANRPREALIAFERIKELPRVPFAIAELRFAEELKKPVRGRNYDAVYQALDAETVDALEDPASLDIFRANVIAQEAEDLNELGETDESRDKYKDALVELEDALKESPENPKLLAARALLEVRLPFPEGRSDEKRILDAKAKLAEGQKEIGDDVELRLAAARLAMMGPPSEGVAEIAKLGETAEYPDEDQTRLFKSLAHNSLGLSLRIPDSAQRKAAQGQALRYSERAAELQAKEIRAQIGLGELAWELKKTAPLETAIKRVTAVEGENGANGNYLKALEIITKAGSIKEITPEDEKRIRDLLNQAMGERHFWPALDRLMGDLEWELGHQQRAVIHYEKAFENGDRSRHAIEGIHRVTQYYKRENQSAMAERFVEKVAIDGRNLLTKEQVAIVEKDYKKIIFYSGLRFKQNQQEAALELLEKARGIAPQEPEPWLALVEYHVRTNEKEKAEALLNDIKENLEKYPAYRLPLTLAKCHEMLGDRKLAETSYQEALKLAKGDDKVAEVREALANFYVRSPKTDPEQQQKDLKNARIIVDELLASDAPKESKDRGTRLKARLIASSGRYEDMEKALKLFEGPDDLSVLDLKTIVRILLVRSRHRDRLALIEVLKRLAEKSPLAAQEKFILARTYDQTDQWSDAKSLYQELLEENKKDTAFLAKYTSSLIAHKEFAEAEPWLKEIKRLEPDSFGTTLLEATFLHAKGDTKAAVVLIQEGVEILEEADSPDQAVTDLVVAGKLEEAVDFLEKQAQGANNAELISALDEVKKLLEEGNTDDAAEGLKRQIVTSNVRFGLEIFQLKAAVKILDGWGELAAAEPIVRRIVDRSKRPEDVLILISNLARQGKIEEAISLCDKAWQTCPAESVGAICVGIVRSGNASPSQMATAERQLLEGIKKHPEKYDLQVQLANLRDYQERYDESEKIYGEVLRKNPNHLVALNNLAWLIALREKKADRAIPLIELAVNRAEKLTGPVPELLDTRAIVYLKVGRNRDAIKDLEMAVDIAAETKPMTYFHLAWAHLANGNRVEAKEIFKKAASLTADDFHPLERPDFEDLSKGLASK